MNYCLGTVQFGLNYGIQGNGRPSEEKVFKMLDLAIDNGIKMLDTASAYGDAEKILGSYISANPEKSENVSIVSKLKPNAFLSIEKTEWSKVVEKNASESLKRLGIEKFAAYLFHNAEYIFDQDAVDALEIVRKLGLSERVGVSVYTPEEAIKALEYPSITAIQIPYNLFDQRLDSCGFFDKAKKQGVLIFARSPLLQGLVMMNPDKLPPRVAFAENYLRKFLSICDEYGISPLRTAVGYVGCKNEIDYVVFGSDNTRQLDEYISLRDTNLPSDMIKKIKETFINIEERLVNPALWK